MAKIRGDIGANSPPKRLRHVDGRTRLGKFMAALRADLTDALGGPARVSPQERLLIDLAVIKAARLAMLSERMLNGETAAEELERRFTWHSNSLRRDLGVLGLERRPEATPRLADVLEGAAP